MPYSSPTSVLPQQSGGICIYVCCYDQANAGLSLYAYVLASRSKTLYVGVTNNMWHRVLQHGEGTGSVFTKRYRVVRLMHVEEFQFILDAIAREKELKDFSRGKKVSLIEQSNSSWSDLAKGWSRDVETLQYDWKRERDR